MARGDWLTNKPDKCDGACTKNPNPYSWAKAVCPWCDPKYWDGKEQGPPRAMSNGQLPQGYVGVYEKKPGPSGQWAPGFGPPPPLPQYNYTITSNGFPMITPAPYVLKANYTKGSITAGSTVTSTAEKLKAVREEAANEERPCTCSMKDLLTFGHTKTCGRKAPIDR